MPNWEITLTERIDIEAGPDDPVLAQSLKIIKDQSGLDYEDLSIELNEDGFPVITPKKDK